MAKTNPRRIKARYTITLTPDIHDTSRDIAAGQGMGLSSLIEQLLRNLIERTELETAERQRALANARRA